MKALRKTVSFLLACALVFCLLPLYALPSFAAPLSMVDYDVVGKTVAQLSADGKELRLIGAVDSLDHESIGFTFTVTDNDHGQITKTYTDKYVYGAVSSNDVTLYSSDLGIDGGYVFILIISDIPSYSNLLVTVCDRRRRQDDRRR